MVKDLRIFATRNIKDMIIVDNAVYSFASQLDNGIPIIPFIDNKSDTRLKILAHYLGHLAECEDVRVLNRRTFELRDLAHLKVEMFIEYYTGEDTNEDYDSCDIENEFFTLAD